MGEFDHIAAALQASPLMAAFMKMAATNDFSRLDKNSAKRHHFLPQFVLRGSMENRSFSAFYLKQGQLIACDAVNRAQEFLILKRMVAACKSFDPVALADESIPLKTLVGPVKDVATSG